MSNVYDIKNHVDYQTHMTDFISKQRVRELLKKYVTQAEQQEVTIAQLKNIVAKQNAALAKCPKPVKPDPCSKCKVNIKEHPEYKRVLGVLDKLTKQPEQCTNDEIKQAKSNLIKLQKRCGAECPQVKPEIKQDPKPEPVPTKCEPCPDKPLPPIEQHPDFERLARELNRKHNSKPLDIRVHPDYAYFKGFYEDKISKMQSELKKHKAKKAIQCKPCKKQECPKCQRCPKCPECKTTKQPACPKCEKTQCPKCPKCIAMTAQPKAKANVPAYHQYNKAPEQGPRPFIQSSISQLNPTAKIKG